MDILSDTYCRKDEVYKKKVETRLW